TSSKLQEFHVNCPEQITNIPIARAAQRLHFLHSSGWPASKGKEIGSYLLHYADGHEERIPIIYGKHVDNCVVAGSKLPGLHAATVHWTGTNSFGVAVRLFHTTWENPSPAALIESMDYLSQSTSAAPLLVALTVEP